MPLQINLTAANLMIFTFTSSYFLVNYPSLFYLKGTNSIYSDKSQARSWNGKFVTYLCLTDSANRTEEEELN